MYRKARPSEQKFSVSEKRNKQIVDGSIPSGVLLNGDILATVR